MTDHETKNIGQEEWQKKKKRSCPWGTRRADQVDPARFEGPTWLPRHVRGRFASSSHSRSSTTPTPSTATRRPSRLPVPVYLRLPDDFPATCRVVRLTWSHGGGDDNFAALRYLPKARFRPTDPASWPARPAADPWGTRREIGEAYGVDLTPSVSGPRPRREKEPAALKRERILATEFLSMHIAEMTSKGQALSPMTVGIVELHLARLTEIRWLLAAKRRTPTPGLPG